MVPDQRRKVFYSQNFLRNPQLVDHLLDGSSLGSDDVVYEIGPGKGLITERLAARCGRVVAIEKDPVLAGTLRRRFADESHVDIHEADFLGFPLPDASYKVFANIPFNVTAAIITKLTASATAPDDIYLVIQEDAARKYTGQPVESLYAVLLKPWFEPAIFYRFKRSDFKPAPRVDVVMLRLRKRNPPLIAPSDAQLFRDFVVYGFTAWKPSLRDAYQDVFTQQQLEQMRGNLGIDPEATPTEIPFEQWLILFYYLKMAGSRRTGQLLAGAEKRLRQQQAGVQKVHRTRTIRKAR